MTKSFSHFAERANHYWVGGGGRGGGKQGTLDKVVAHYHESLTIFPGNFTPIYFSLMGRVAGAGRN